MNADRHIAEDHAWTRRRITRLERSLARADDISAWHRLRAEIRSLSETLPMSESERVAA